MAEESSLGADAAIGADAAEAGAGETPQSYEAAVGRLEEIIARLDSGKAELRETLDLCREGKVLVEYCKGELDDVSGELQRLDLDDLVRKLESGAAESP